MLRHLYTLSLVLAIAACSREEAPAVVEKVSPDTGDNPFLVHVPAATPYFFATRQALDKDLALEVMKRSGYDRASVKAQIADLRATAGEDVGKFLDMADAIIDEIGEFADAATYERLGTKVNPHMAVYGIGLMPVARMEIADRARFSAFLDRVLKIVELEPVRLPHGDRSLLRFEVETVAILISIGNSDVVLTAAKTDAEASMIALLLGDAPPARSLADAGTLQALEREHGFTPFMLGRIDSANLLAEIEKPSVRLVEAFDASELFSGEHCRDELHAMAARFPGMAFGSRRFDADVREMSMVFLTDAELAADFATLPSPVPGLGAGGGLASIGFGMQLPKLASLFSKWAGALSSRPYACEKLAELNQMADGLRQAAANPVLLMAGPAASGILVRLERLSLDDISEPDVEGVLTLASPSPQALLAMGSGFLPPLAGMNVTPGGDAVAVPADLLQEPVRTAFLALDDKALALAVNSKDGTAARQALAAPAGPADLLLHMHFRGEIYRLIADAMASASPDDPQMQRMAADFRRNADMFESGDINIRTTAKGVEMEVVTRMR
ncbi:MAG TPA: hypothetical protein PKZ76_00840 [Xanthomonadaceae bacterium]|nr:hypothetical protein [Xanthomonadaceae bacterium]